MFSGMTFSMAIIFTSSNTLGLNGMHGATRPRGKILYYFFVYYFNTVKPKPTNL